MENTLIINNFKCFLDAEIPIKRLTILAGGNSVGKSSVIQGLLLLRSAINRLEARIDKVMLNGDYLLRLGNSIDVISNNASSDLITIAFKQHRYNKTIKFDFSVDSKKEPQVFLNIKSPKTSPRENITNSHHPLLNANFHYLNAERLGPRPFYEVADKGKNVGWQGEHTISLLSSSVADTRAYEIPEKKIFPGTKNRQIKSQVEAWMREIVPGLTIDPKKISEINQAYVKYGGVSPNNVGFGISYVLPIVVSGLIAEKGEMLIVENPEAHLHPSGQSRIGKFLAMVAAYGTEVIVETHSEHVINGIRLATLEKNVSHEDVMINFFSEPNDNMFTQPEIRSISLNENADLDNWPKGFFDQQQEDIARIFKLRKQNKQ